MQRLPDGLFAVLLPDGSVAIRGGGEPLDLAAAERGAALALSRGRDADEPAGALPHVEGDAADPVIEARLAALGRGFAWHLAALEEGEALCAQVRRIAARHKAFGGLSSLSLLPESAAGLALRLSARLDEEQEVLVHGGQLLVGLALAARGRAVTVWTEDEAARDLARALAAEGAPLRVHEADLLAPLPEALRGRFGLVLVDTLAADRRETLLFARALAATREGGRVVALVHSMRRALTRRLLAELPVDVEEALHEAAVRLHPGWAPAEFSWDAWVLAPTGAPPIAADDAISDGRARDLDPSEQSHGCVEVQGLAPAGITPARLDRAIALFTAALPSGATATGGHDDEGHLARYVALPAGGQAALSVDKARGVAAVDLFPWSPFTLAALVGALLVELPRSDEEVPS